MNRIAGRSGIALLLVLVLVGGLVFFIGEYLLEAKEWINVAGSPHVYNGGNIGCGVVLDRNGELLLDTTDQRTYPESLSLRKSVIHWVGDREGNISAPALPNYSDALSGFDLINGIYSYAGTGGEAVLTLSARVQTVAMEALDGYKGTIAVYNYKTGEILCAVSAPSYDPDDVPDILGDTTGDYEGAYLNRFTQACYVPGSIFKILTTAAAIEALPNAMERTFFCEGSYFVDGNEVTCGREHGEQDLAEAMKNSCNCVYAQIALELGADTLQSYVDRYELTDSIQFDGITTEEGYFDLTGLKTEAGSVNQYAVRMPISGIYTVIFKMKSDLGELSQSSMTVMINKIPLKTIFACGFIIFFKSCIISANTLCKIFAQTKSYFSVNLSAVFNSNEHSSLLIFHSILHT